MIKKQIENNNKYKTNIIYTYIYIHIKEHIKTYKNIYIYKYKI